MEEKTNTMTTKSKQKTTKDKQMTTNSNKKQQKQQQTATEIATKSNTKEQMKEQLRKDFTSFGEVNDKIIENKARKGIMNVAIILNKYLNPEIISLNFKDYNEKMMIKEALKQIVANKEVNGYITIFDTKITKINKKTNNYEEVQDCVVRSLCSPALNIKEIIIYDEKTRKIISKEILCDSDLPEHKEILEKMRDEWNLWGIPFDNENKEDIKMQKEYSKFKRENPEKYRGVV
jgi:hypothetical protein